MDIIQSIKDTFTGISPELLAVLITALIGFISWIIKGLIENPLKSSKETFNRYMDKRIEVLTQMKTHLLFISYFPNKEDSKKFKEELQKIVLQDGKVGYLNKDTLANIVRVSIEETTNEKLVTTTLQDIDRDLAIQIGKAQDEISFYTKFSHHNPFKKIVGLAILVLQNVITLGLSIGIITLLCYGLITATWYLKIGLIVIALIVIILLNLWSQLSEHL